MSSFPFVPGLLYLGKMTLISAVLYGYYRAFLQDSSFHRYNRWYLMGSVLISVVLPFLRLPFPARWMNGGHYSGIFAADRSPDGSEGIPAGGSEAAFAGSSHGFVYDLFRGWGALYVLYGLIAGVFVWLLLRSLLYLLRLSRNYAFTRQEGIRFFQTGEPGTPFSFWNLLFWNKDLDLGTEQGQFIFRHELYHIRQKHTLDILLLSGVRSLFWCNPFFHLILRELKVIHEFLADRYAFSAGVRAGGLQKDRFDYAEWLVWQSVGGGGRAVAHSFFNTHLKRRITMITQSKQSRPRFISRLMALPLAFLLLCAFAAGTSRGHSIPSSGKRPVVADSGRQAVNSIVRHYTHYLRYPDVAINQGKEETIWFSVRVGDHNQIISFTQYDAAPVVKTRNAFTITVTSLPAHFPDDKGAGATLTEGNKKEVFMAEARKASEKISSDTGRVFAPGEYYFTIIFRLEKPAGTDSSLSLSIKYPGLSKGQAVDLDLKTSQEPN
jgi:hypothetical protein